MVDDFGTGWTRLVSLSGDLWLGLAGGELYVGSHDAPIRRVDRARPTGLLPLLERPRPAVIAELRQCERDVGLGDGFLVAFIPFGAILAEAVASELDYWVHLALDWLEEYSEKNVATGLLSKIEHAAWATQHARHRSRHLSKRFAG
ncbi:hypothetical protein [Luteimicrobium subarcticum]|uniref:hypothetical protein n=1 Tax=Luteimicrobium subarcticum TaxID=620910 RepID=UPI0012FE5E2F|nr:hypothetical protein [Luteimicrobium subarcticum]